MQDRRSNNLKLTGVLIALVVLLLANWRLVAGHEQRQEANRALDSHEVPATLMLVTIAVGPLRGLIADALWWRAIEMQDRGNFFEAIQLADWISKLQPSMSMVWAYHGWNLSSNIVNETNRPDERWKWVLKGIELLRDEGLRYNPGNLDIRLELASIFLRRIGSTSDPYHQYYRQQWVTITLQYLERGDREEIQAIAAAPATPRQLRAEPTVASLLDSADAVGIDLLDPFTYHHDEQWTTEQRQVLANPIYADAANLLQLYHARRGLEDVLKMRPQRMLLIDKHYGPLDWRLWQAQVIYWASSDFMSDDLTDDEVYTTGLVEDSFIRQAMLSSFYEGRFVYMNEERLMTTNNIEILGKVDEFMHHALEASGDFHGAHNLMKMLHERAAVVLYNYLYVEEARIMYDAYYEEYASPEERRGLTFESFIMSRASSLIEGQARDKESLVLSLLYQAYMWLALGEGNKAKGYENMAQLVWATHQKQTKREEKKLPPFDDLERIAIDLATGERSTLPEDLQETLRSLRGDNARLNIVPSKQRPPIGLGIHGHEHDH